MVSVLRTLLVVFLAGMLLASCVGTPQTRATSGLTIACDTYATVLDQLTPRRKAGKLSAAVVERINAANAQVKPACARDSLLDPAAVVGTVQMAIGLLNAVKGAN